jgi:hypothetical protein
MDVDQKYHLKELTSDDILIPPDSLIDVDALIKEKYTCSTCNYIVRTPKMCNNCTSLVCTICINDSDTCKKCNIEYKTANQIITADLINIITKCPNLNCTIQVKYESILSHLGTCKLTKRIAICSGCLKEIPTKNTTKEIKLHYISCREVMKKCPYCNGTFGKIDYPVHMGSCELKPVVCPQCELTYTYTEYASHDWAACVGILKARFANSVNREQDNVNDKSIEANKIDVTKIVKYYEIKLREKDKAIETNEENLKVMNSKLEYYEEKTKDYASMVLSNYKESKSYVLDHITLTELISNSNNEKLDLSNRRFDFKLIINLKVIVPLKELNLERTKIDNDIAVKLADLLCASNSLLVLNLSNNYIGNNGAKALAKAVAVNKTLEEIYLSNNCFSNTGILAFAETLKDNKALLVLYLDGNFENEFYKAFVRDMMGNNGLIKYKGVFRQAFKANRTLQILNLSLCEVKPYIKDIFNGLDGNKSLKQLILSNPKGDYDLKRKLTELKSPGLHMLDIIY